MIWLICTTSPQRERHVAAELHRGLGLATYVPVERVEARRPRGGKAIVRAIPLMRGYVFVGARYGFPWHDIAASRDVTGWLCRDGDVPAYVQQREIDRIRDLENEYNRERHQRPASLGVGAKVRVTKGAFESVESLLRAVRGSTATIEVPMLGSTRSVQVPLAHLAGVA